MSARRSILLARLLACGLVVGLLLFGACNRGAPSGSELDLTIARDAYAGGYFLEAETAYERYLQSDPQGKHRLEAWTRLVEISSGVKGDVAKAVTLLETATLEYNSRPEVNWPLLYRLGELYELQGQRKKALDAWGRCLDTSGGDVAKAVKAQMRMAVANRALGKHDLALELLTQCVAQAKDVETKSQAMYEMAQTLSLSWQWAKAITILDEILALDKAPQDVKIMSAYLLADAYEAQRNIPKAREILLSLKETYPNPEVIVTRLATLGQQHGAQVAPQLQPGDGLPDETDPAIPRSRRRR